MLYDVIEGYVGKIIFHLKVAIHFSLSFSYFGQFFESLKNSKNQTKFI